MRIAEDVRFLAVQTTFFLLGWYTSLGGLDTYWLITVVSKAALVSIQPVPQLLISFYLGKTVMALLRGRTRA